MFKILPYLSEEKKSQNKEWLIYAYKKHVLYDVAHKVSKVSNKNKVIRKKL